MNLEEYDHDPGPCPLCHQKIANVENINSDYVNGLLANLFVGSLFHELKSSVSHLAGLVHLLRHEPSFRASERAHDLLNDFEQDLASIRTLIFICFDYYRRTDGVITNALELRRVYDSFQESFGFPLEVVIKVPDLPGLHVDYEDYVQVSRAILQTILRRIGRERQPNLRIGLFTNQGCLVTEALSMGIKESDDIATDWSLVKLLTAAKRGTIEVVPAPGNLNIRWSMRDQRKS